MSTPTLCIQNALLLSLLLTLSFHRPITAIPGVVTVTTTADSGAGSLRQALLDVNSDPISPHIIEFSIGSGVKVIQPATALPEITVPYVLIDGTTQPGWAVGEPMIVLDGSQLTPYTENGLVINGGYNCLIRGLVINNGFNNGIVISSSGGNADSNVITDCFIGVDQTGTAAAGNKTGILIQATPTSAINNCIIGGGSYSPNNIISGNSDYGIALISNVNFTTISNNVIGTDIDGTKAIPNGLSGILLLGSTTPVITEQCFQNFIQSNLISGNTGSGISLQSNAIQNIIQNNTIGLDSSGIVALANAIGISTEGQIPPNPADPLNGSVEGTSINNNIIAGNSSHGILLSTNTMHSSINGNIIGSDSTVTVTNVGNGNIGISILGTTDAPCIENSIGLFQGNTILYNTSGIVIDGDPSTPSINNAIITNSISQNGNDGITLLNNSNNTQSAPTIINALLNADGNGITIAVQAPTTPSATLFRIDCFMSTADHSPITEGQQYLGSIVSLPSGATDILFCRLPTTLSSNVWISAVAIAFNGPTIHSSLGDSSPYTGNSITSTLTTNIPPIMFP